MLQLRGVSLAFGGLAALRAVDLDVAERTIVGLVGPNGAGKTSLFNCISGAYVPTEGSITLGGVDLLALPVHRIAATGVARTFQHPVLLPEQTVLESVLVGAHPHLRAPAVAHALGLRSARREERELRAAALEVLDRLAIAEVADVRTGDLPHGTQKRVEIARALLLRPRLVLLDEPASGLTHSEVDELGAVIRSLRDALELTVVLVEHHMGLVSTVTDKVVALVEGRKVAEGSAAQVQRDPTVVAAYLGTAA
ncbi:ABC transporter ATP-binding protein [Modestobacter lapidis]|nr:ABC transporter ATP-binding protein [Modestobacter lapidis]